MIHLLCEAILQQHDKDFVNMVSLQLRNREPNILEVGQYLYSLSSGVSRIDYIIHVWMSYESKCIYNTTYKHGEPPTIANIFRNTLTYFPEQLVQTLFRELLCREVKPEELTLYQEALRNGHSPVELFASILDSVECRMLLEAMQSNPVHDRLKLYHI